ncbi:MAG: hypothetical protein ACRD0E_08415 [Acidimicrobiales bacterium]
MAGPRDLDKLIVGDARHMDEVSDSSVALVVTSPPYFAGKEYEESSVREVSRLPTWITSTCYVTSLPSVSASWNPVAAWPSTWPISVGVPTAPYLPM